MQKIVSIIRKEFLQIRRDRAMRGLIFFMPIAQLLVLGYVVSSEVKNISTVICDLDASPVSRELIDRVHNSGYFDIRYYDNQEDKIADYLDSGRASMALVIPQKLAKNLQNAQTSEIQVLVDGQDSNTSTIALGYMAGILESFISDRMATAINSAAEAGGEVRLVTANIRIWYNQNLKYSDYMVPGIAVFLLTMVSSLISAMGLVREREIGTLEQLLVAPIKKYELLIGKIIPFAIVGLIELVIAIVFAKLWYHIPIVGNLALFFLFAVVYLFTTLGIGLFVSASSQTQQQAIFMTWFIMMFVFLMSGFLFPIENMPRAAQAITYLNPMRYFIIVVREIFIKGADLRHLYGQGIALCIFGVVTFSVAVLRFQNRIR